MKKEIVWTHTWRAGLISLAIVILILLAGCASVNKREVLGGPYPANPTLPEVLNEYSTPTGKYIGWIQVGGSANSALSLARKESARLGARYIKIEPTTFDMDVTKYEYYRDGGVVTQRPIGTETVRASGYDVYLYR